MTTRSSPSRKAHARCAHLKQISPATTPFHAEDFDIIPPEQHLYGCDGEANLLVKLHKQYLTNVVGQLLITDAGERTPADGKVFVVKWNPAISNFTAASIQYRRPNGTIGKLEHVTFSPIDFPTLNP